MGNFSILHVIDLPMEIYSTREYFYSGNSEDQLLSPDWQSEMPKCDDPFAVVEVKCYVIISIFRKLVRGFNSVSIFI